MQPGGFLAVVQHLQKFAGHCKEGKNTVSGATHSLTLMQSSLKILKL